MIANGLTKALSRSEYHEFLQQVNLVDIASQIAERTSYGARGAEDPIQHVGIFSRAELLFFFCSFNVRSHEDGFLDMVVYTLDVRMS
jgi:hypothetical protein